MEQGATELPVLHAFTEMLIQGAPEFSLDTSPRIHAADVLAEAEELVLVEQTSCVSAVNGREVSDVAAHSAQRAQSTVDR